MICRTPPLDKFACGKKIKSVGIRPRCVRVNHTTDENSAFFAQFGCHHCVPGSGDSQQNLFSGGGLGIYQVHEPQKNFGNQAQEGAKHSQGALTKIAKEKQSHGAQFLQHFDK